MSGFLWTVNGKWVVFRSFKINGTLTLTCHSRPLMRIYRCILSTTFWETLYSVSSKFEIILTDQIPK